MSRNVKPVKQLEPMHMHYDDSDNESGVEVEEVEEDPLYDQYKLSDKEKKRLTINYINKNKNSTLDFTQDASDSYYHTIDIIYSDKLLGLNRKQSADKYHINYMKKFEKLKVINMAKMKLIIIKYILAKRFSNELLKHFQLITNERNDWMSLINRYASSTSYITDELNKVNNDWLTSFKKELVKVHGYPADLYHMCNELIVKNNKLEEELSDARLAMNNVHKSPTMWDHDAQALWHNDDLPEYDDNYTFGDDVEVEVEEEDL